MSHTHLLTDLGGDAANCRRLCEDGRCRRHPTKCPADCDTPLGGKILYPNVETFMDSQASKMTAYRLKYSLDSREVLTRHFNIATVLRPYGSSSSLPHYTQERERIAKASILVSSKFLFSTQYVIRGWNWAFLRRDQQALTAGNLNSIPFPCRIWCLVAV